MMPNVRTTGWITTNIEGSPRIFHNIFVCPIMRYMAMSISFGWDAHNSHLHCRHHRPLNISLILPFVNWTFWQSENINNKSLIKSFSTVSDSGMSAQWCSSSSISLGVSVFILPINMTYLIIFLITSSILGFFSIRYLYYYFFHIWNLDLFYRVGILVFFTFFMFSLSLPACGIWLATAVIRRIALAMVAWFCQWPLLSLLSMYFACDLWRFFSLLLRTYLTLCHLEKVKTWETQWWPTLFNNHVSDLMFVTCSLYTYNFCRDFCDIDRCSIAGRNRL